MNGLNGASAEHAVLAAQLAAEWRSLGIPGTGLRAIASAATASKVAAAAH